MQVIPRFFGVDVGADWQRPRPTPAQRRADLWLTLGWLVMIAAGTELFRGLGELETTVGSVLTQYAGVLTVCVLLIWRRRFPLTVALLATVHLFVSPYVVGAVMATLPMQVLYFFALYTGIAWARDRQWAMYLAGAVMLMLFLWFTWVFTINREAADYLEELGVAERSGLLSVLVSYAGYVGLTNLIFFVGAIVLGQFAWNGALSAARTADQAATIAEQSEQLRDQAVVSERLRIARELHDVVAHHISAMGVQAAAARRVLTHSPEQVDAATQALGSVEDSSRDAVRQMRALLGALRTGEAVADGAADRAPQPRLAAIPDLVRDARDVRLDIDYRLVEATPGLADAAPMPLQLTIYRVVQESLANVLRHSTATHVSVVIRVDDYVEVEVVDNGRARPGSSGSGLGQLGIRERAAHHDGTVEIGPRYGGGYRVRVRFPAESLEPAAVAESSLGQERQA